MRVLSRPLFPWITPQLQVDSGGGGGVGTTVPVHGMSSYLEEVWVWDAKWGLVGNIGQVLHPHELRHRAPRLARHLRVGSFHNLLFMHPKLMLRSNPNSNHKKAKTWLPHVRTVPKNSKEIFPEMKLRGLVFPNFYIHVSVRNLCIPTISLPIFLYCMTRCNGPGFDPSIRRHSGIWGAADEAVLNIVRKKKLKKSPKTSICSVYLVFVTTYSDVWFRLFYNHLYYPNLNCALECSISSWISSFMVRNSSWTKVIFCIDIPS